MGATLETINREVLWKKHEMIKSQLRAWKQWYDTHGPLIEELDQKRQEIVRRYFQFEDGKILVNEKGQYSPLPGVDTSGYDKEMEALMSGTEQVPKED